MKITMLEPISISEDMLEKLSEPLREKGHEVELCVKPLSDEEKLARTKDADVIIIANTPLSENIINNATKLKMISVAFTGVDHVPSELCRKKNILVSNSQGYATIAVTELVLGFTFSCLRNLIPCDNAAKNELTKDGLVGSELHGKTFGTVGYGAIGRSVANTAKFFGCKTLAYSNHPSPYGGDGIVEFCSLEHLLEQSDIVSIHVPLNEQTKRLIDRDKLALMKPSAYLINTSRGGVIDSQALADALNSGRIAGAGLDVFDTEPPLKKDDPLVSAKNTILAPHVGFATKDAMIKRGRIVFKNITAWIDGSPINIKIQ